MIPAAWAWAIWVLSWAIWLASLATAPLVGSVSVSYCWVTCDCSVVICPASVFRLSATAWPLPMMVWVEPSWFGALE